MCGFLLLQGLEQYSTTFLCFLQPRTNYKKLKKESFILTSCYLHHSGWNMLTVHATGSIIAHSKITGRGVSPSTLLPPSLPWWQTSPLLVIETTSFPKYQKPYWIIKYVYTGVHISRRSQTLLCPEHRAVFVELQTQKRWKDFFFHSPTFIWSRFSNSTPPPTNPPVCPKYSGRVALCGDSRTETLVKSTRKPVITQKARLPSGHTSPILQT